MSFLALVATFYQAHLQRVHNQKSVKPLTQIDLLDREGVLFIHIVNNGVGPVIIDKLTFTKEGKKYHRIQDCLDIDQRSYYHIDISSANKKVITPGGFMPIFSQTLEPREHSDVIAKFQAQLSLLHLKVEGQDIYNNKVSVEKNLSWFARHH